MIKWEKNTEIGKSLCKSRPIYLSIAQIDFAPQPSQSSRCFGALFHHNPRPCFHPLKVRKITMKKFAPNRVPLIGGLPPNPDFIQNYFLLKRMFDFFDNRDKCRLPGFLRGNIYTSCISMLLLDHFANINNTFQHTLSFPISLSPSRPNHPRKRSPPNG